MTLQEQFGQIDIYLFDQLLRGRITAGLTIFDAGCGGGRNLVYFLREGFDVRGVDADAAAIAQVRALAARLAPALPEDSFRVEPLDAISFAPSSADVVVSSAVLHFAKDDAEFDALLAGSWGVLKPGGLFFCRLASSTGMEDRVRRIAGRVHQLPDGSTRYLVDDAMLMETTRALGGTLLDPLKTSVVQNQRCMSTWVVRKG